ncbi:MAG: T9SS type A sorting domain-containing protein [Chitinophagaceae bacterium]|nr:T9SS type A sorting domain-containing protein [Chitinophagaceae bacterium]
MKSIYFSCLLIALSVSSIAQHVGIVRKNFYSQYYDSVLNINVQMFDSSTIRLGSVNTQTGNVTNLGGAEYTMNINLTGATVDPYANRYFVSSGNNLLTFDIANGALAGNAPISGPLATSAFQNYRFNPSDTVIYGLVPDNYYSTYFDSLTMSLVQVLDSAHIRFASIDPVSGIYALIGNAHLDNVYTLAGNSIDPHQMVFYYSAVDTLVGIDLYTGSVYSQAAIQLPPHAFFENFTYSCADSSIYGLTRQNYFVTVYDSVLQQFVDLLDSTTIRLSKIDPATGIVSYISPSGIALGATLNGSCFIDPNTMTYYFSTGPDLVGVSLLTGLITTSVVKTFQGGATFFDMMRSTQNCFGSEKVRTQIATTSSALSDVSPTMLRIVPNPAHDYFSIQSAVPVSAMNVYDLAGKLLLSSSAPSLNIRDLPPGLYSVKLTHNTGEVSVLKLLKQ